jgi:hypothetical protein
VQSYHSLLISKLHLLVGLVGLLLPRWSSCADVLRRFVEKGRCLPIVIAALPMGEVLRKREKEGQEGGGEGGRHPT